MRLSSVCSSLLGCCLLAATSNVLIAQDMAAKGPAVGSKVPPSQVYDKLLSGMEKEFVDAAEAMPADKFDFAPPTSMGDFKGVRSFGGQVKHVAEANYYFFGGGKMTEAENKAKSESIEKLTSKDDIINALKESFTFSHAYIARNTDENAFVMTKAGTRGGMAAFGIAHLMDHYGQMVVYLRMNGIVPPASRK
jgi:uncharacterized damage-inducible protein DinB